MPESLPTYIKDQAYTWVLNHLHHQGGPFDARDMAIRAQAAVGGGGEWQAPVYHLQYRNIALAANRSLNAGSAEESDPNTPVDPASMGIDPGLDRAEALIRYRTRVQGENTDTGEKFNVLVNIESNTPLDATDIHIRSIDCVQAQACGPPPPSWVPTATIVFTSTVISAGRAR